MATTLDNLDVRVYLDYPQERKSRFGPYVFATDGAHLDDSTAVNCIIDPVTQSVFGTPLPMTASWKTTFSGKYARIQKSEYTFSSPATSSDWLDFDYYGTGDTYLISGSSNAAKQAASVKLTSGVKRNEALFFSYSKLEKQENNSQYLFKLYWQASAFPIYDTILMFRSDGGCDVFRGYNTKESTITFTTGSTTLTGTNTLFNDNTATGDKLQAGSKIYTSAGEYVGTVSTITNNTTIVLTALPKFAGTSLNWFATGTTDDSVFIKKVKSYGRTEQNFNANRTLTTNRSPNSNFNDVYIIPCRGKDLLVMGSNGLNFCHTFDDLDDPYPPKNTINDTVNTDVSNNVTSFPVILPSGDFAVVVSTGKLMFQLARLNFLVNYSIKSQPIDIVNEVFPNSGLFFQGSAPTNRTFRCDYSTDNTLRKQIKLISGANLSTIPVNSRIYLQAQTQTNSNTQFAMYLAGTVASNTVDTITLNSTSDFFTNDIGDVYAATVPPKTGTITCSTSSSIITGVGTAFNTEVVVNDWLFDNQDRVIGQVKSITSNTSLTLYDNPLFTISTGVGYWVNLPNLNLLYNNINVEFTSNANSTLNDRNTSTNLTIVDDFGNDGGINPRAVFAPNKTRRLKFTATNNINSGSTYAANTTAVIYSADTVLVFNNEVLNNTAIDITSAIEQLNVQRLDDGGMEIGFSARKQTLSDLGVTKPDILGNRAIKITLKPRGVIYNEVTLFEGFLEPPDIDYIQGVNYDKYALLSYKGYDKKKALYNVYFSQAPSFEDSLGFNDLQTILDYNLLFGGFNNNGLFVPKINYKDTKIYNFSFDANRMNSAGQYSSLLVPNLGDTVGSFLEKIRNDILNNFTLVSKYNWSFDNLRQKFINTPSLNLEYNYKKSSSSLMTLYLNENTANSLGSIPIDKAYKRTIRGMKKTYQSPEANKITVIGIDKNNNNRISITKMNTNNSDPYLSVANRSNDWVGETKEFVISNPDYSSLKIVENANNQFFERLSNGREILEFTSDFLTYLDTTDTFELNTEYYKQGLVKWTSGSTTVNGAATYFKTQFTAGDKIYAITQQPTQTVTLIGTISSISSDTSLTLTSAPVASGSSSYVTNKVLNGTITTLSYSTGVTGVGTNFTTQFTAGDKIYVATTGEFLGTIASITNDTNLILTANPGSSLTNVNYSKLQSYKFLNEFNYIDKNDTIAVSDLSGNLTYYKINSWSLDFVKDYTNATADEVIVRNCNYQAEKTTISSNVDIFELSRNNDDYNNINNAVTGNKLYIGHSTKPLVFAGSKFKNFTMALISPPSGATLMETASDNSIGATSIEYTPVSAQENQIITLQLQITPEGQSPVNFYYKVRVFPTL